MWETMELPDMLQEELRRARSGDSGVSLNEVGTLAYGVYYYHDHVVPTRVRKLHNEIYA